MNSIEQAAKSIAVEEWAPEPAPGGFRPMYLLGPGLFVRFAPVHGATGKSGRQISGLDLWAWQLIFEGPSRRRVLIRGVAHFRELLRPLQAR